VEPGTWNQTADSQRTKRVGGIRRMRGSKAWHRAPGTWNQTIDSQFIHQ
jgi:hypothetical protein